MRIEVQGPPGVLASRPLDALEALASIAEADGADREDWLAKAAGAHAPVQRDPLYQPAKDAVAEALRLYRGALPALRAGIRARLEAAARDVDTGNYRRLAGEIGKARRGQLQLITPGVVRDIAKLIRDYHTGVAAVLFGRDAVSDDDWKIAQGLGLVTGDDPVSVAETLHTYGAFLAHIDQANVQSRYGMSLDDFRAEVARNPIPMTQHEHHASRYMRVRGAQAIVGLGNKVGATVGSRLIEADQALDRHMRGIIRDVVSARFGDDTAAQRIRAAGADKGLSDDFFDEQFRTSINRQVSDIGHLTDDWARDIQRIVQTESHGAVQEGMKESWVEQEEELARDQNRAPRRLLAYKLPRPDACRDCNRLHLAGDTPRLYYLDEIEGNGTNVGKKRADWSTVIGSTHPWCACSLHRVPAILDMPKGWRSGESAPKLIGPGGRLVMP